jgi:uncharacterized repeat protein (TIGR03943 family)
MVAAVTGGTLISLVGAVVLRLTLTGDYLRFVKEGMRPWLLVAGVVLALLGVVTAARALRGQGDGEHDQPREGWLILAPIAVLLLVAPPALGSYGVDRAAAVTVTSHSGEFPPLPKSDDAVPMTLLEYGQRSFDGDGHTLQDATVQLTGFVADGASSDTFRLARYQIACCAADAAPAIVEVVGVSGSAPPRDEWVTVTGSFAEPDGETPRLTAVSVQQIPPPEDPYE